MLVATGTATELGLCFAPSFVDGMMQISLAKIQDAVVPDTGTQYKLHVNLLFNTRS